MGESDEHHSPGPNPSTLRSVDRVPDGVNAIPMRITYRSDRVSDYINFKRDGRDVRLELAGPLFSIVTKAGEIADVASELSAALSTIQVTGIGEGLREAIAEYTNAILSVPAFTASISIGVAAYLIKKLFDSERLVIGVIHQASVDELPSWLGLVEEAKENPDINVS